MGDISIELVPRSRASIESELAVLGAYRSSVNKVNIPDLLRFDLRSWEACESACGLGIQAIPHLRAMDFSADSVGALVSRLHVLGIDEVLVVQGDPPQNPTRPVYSTTSVELIRLLRQAAPQLRIHAVFDPYRKGLMAELDGVAEKLEAGASGLFTQPFFDLRYAQVCADLLPTKNVYWGVAPVLSAASRRYWEVTNRTCFPSDFVPDMAWNRALARRFLSWRRESDLSLYFMPIRIDLHEYLHGLF